MGRRKKEAVVVTAQTSGETVKGGGMGHQGTIGIDPERAEIIAQYEKEHQQSSEPPTVDNSIEPVVTEPLPPAVIPTTTPQQFEPSASPAVNDGENRTENSADTERKPVAETMPPLEKESPEHKTVRLEALHEEREKRKAVTAANKKLEERIKELEAKVNQNQALDGYEAGNEFLTPEEIRIATLEREINAIKSKETEKESRAEKETFNKTLSDVDKALSDEGFPGFMFLSGRVGDELTKLVNEDPDNAYLNAPDGWKKIYREKVFPAVRGIFSDMAKKSVMDGKTAAKTNVALAGSHGQAPPAPKKANDNGWSFEQYLEHRMKHSL
ncbi:MAG: hypothetical protein NUW09_02540 [Deltaproteobacteria bacterium]|nr:hypothetical protein [Deltaproteobacteria bacterium]